MRGPGTRARTATGATVLSIPALLHPVPLTSPTQRTSCGSCPLCAPPHPHPLHQRAGGRGGGWSQSSRGSTPTPSLARWGSGAPGGHRAPEGVSALSTATRAGFLSPVPARPHTLSGDSGRVRPLCGLLGPSLLERPEGKQRAGGFCLLEQVTGASHHVPQVGPPLAPPQAS